MPFVEYKTIVAAKREKVFEFYEKVESLPVITPKKMNFRVSSDSDKMVKGAEIVLHFKILNLFTIRWVKFITAHQSPERFEDVQKSGPLKSWHHTHLFLDKDGGTEVIDQVEYELPLGPIGKLADRLFVQKILNNMFGYRHQKTVEMFGIPRN